MIAEHLETFLDQRHLQGSGSPSSAHLCHDPGWFFRYDSKAKVIIYAWANDSDTLRIYGAKNDAYAVFRKMLEKGTPPDDWNALLKAAKELAVAGV